MRHLSYAVPKVTSQAFARKYIMLGRLVTQWADIVGADLAAKTQPVATRYYKAGGKASKPSISLDIAAASAEATILMYRKDLILERINQMFGQGWISAIRFVPSSPGARRARPRKTTKTLTEAQKSCLSDVLGSMADDDLKARLQSLGTAILQDGQT